MWNLGSSASIVVGSTRTYEVHGHEQRSSRLMSYAPIKGNARTGTSHEHETARRRTTMHDNMTARRDPHKHELSTCTHMTTLIRTQSLLIIARMRTHTRIPCHPIIQASIHACIHPCTHACIHACTHVHMHWQSSIHLSRSINRSIHRFIHPAQLQFPVAL